MNFEDTAASNSSMERVIEWSISNKGKKCLIVDNYKFVVKNQFKLNRTQWRCSQYKICNARCITKDDKIESGIFTHLHNHKENVNPEIEKLTKTNPYARPAQIVSKMHLENYGDRVLPTDQKIKSHVKYLKRKAFANDPQTLDELSCDINTVDGDNFLLKDNECTDGNRIIIFATKHSVKRLMCCDQWMADATFNVVPTIFGKNAQLFTIMGKGHNQWFSFLFAVMQRKSEEAYDFICQSIVNECCSSSIDIPTNLTIHLDFEKQSANAFKKFFPNARIARCIFHLSQSLYRKVQQAGFHLKYCADQNFENNVRYLVATAFLPISEVPSTLEELEAIFDDETSVIFEYFDHVYGRGRPAVGSHRMSAQYPMSEWNVYNKIEENIERTNNVIEGMHLRLKVLSGRAHINAHEFFSMLLSEHSKTEHNIRQNLANGARGIPKSRKILEKESNILSLFNKYKNSEISKIDYLYGIGQNLKIS